MRSFVGALQGVTSLHQMLQPRAPLALWALPALLPMSTAVTPVMRASSLAALAPARAPPAPWANSPTRQAAANAVSARQGGMQMSLGCHNAWRVTQGATPTCKAKKHAKRALWATTPLGRATRVATLVWLDGTTPRMVPTTATPAQLVTTACMMKIWVTTPVLAATSATSSLKLARCTAPSANPPSLRMVWARLIARLVQLDQ